MRLAYSDVAVTVPVTIPYQRYSIETAHWWIARALREALCCADLRPGELDGLCVSSFTLFPDNVAGLVQHLGLSPRWLDTIAAGGASGVIALRRAARAVQCGDAHIVACVAGDTNHIDSFRRMLSSFSRFALDASYPYGFGGPNANFALLTDRYMREFDVKREDFGKLCIAQRENALRNPNAIMKKPLSMAQYLSARPIADPIALYDCVMPVAGAEAFLVMPQHEAQQRGLAYAKVDSSIERHNAFKEDSIQLRGGWAQDVDALYAMAKCTPTDIDLLQSYDDYPVICFMQFEDLAFCEKGYAAEFVRQQELTVDGSFPHNTSGGQLSAGQAGAAGGYIGLVEAIRQITQSAGPTQVPHARRALVSGFGMINYDRGVCSAATILSSGKS